MKLYSVFEIRKSTTEFEIKIDTTENKYEMRVVKDYKDIGLFDNKQQAKNIMNDEINNWVEILNEDIDEHTQYFKDHDTIVKNTYDENNILYNSETIRKYFIKEFEIEE